MVCGRRRSIRADCCTRFCPIISRGVEYGRSFQLYCVKALKETTKIISSAEGLSGRNKLFTSRSDSIFINVTTLKKARNLANDGLTTCIDIYYGNNVREDGVDIYQGGKR